MTNKIMLDFFFIKSKNEIIYKLIKNEKTIFMTF